MLAPSNSLSKSNVGQPHTGECRTLRFRCPSCQKLYVAQTDKLKGHRAEFECIRCHCHFAFKLPAGGYNLVPTFTVNKEPRPPASHAPVVPVDKQIHGSLECPKCGATNSSKDSECWRCQVILDRVKDLPLQMGRKASPAVVALWKQVVGAVDRPKLHELFLKECQRRQQLDYALDRYTQLCEAQPQDRELASYLIMAEQMKAAEEQKANKKQGFFASTLPPKTILLFAPIVLSLILIAAGLSHATMRNLVGLGAAILVLYGGTLAVIWTPQRKPKTWVSRVQGR